GLEKHWENFISVVRSRKIENLNCSIEDGAHVATVAQMGNISFRSGERVIWDKAAGRFTNKKLNDEYYMKAYHNGYKLPSVV
ncbi:MAG TPA: gfo/Idh/MocA family oxidoreductase, partial [Flavisolibacter sp.]|nr:gfo/Idh/MocA family oxidoreductase [Flavisolibacter sp.]